MNHFVVFSHAMLYRFIDYYCSNTIQFHVSTIITTTTTTTLRRSSISTVTEWAGGRSKNSLTGTKNTVEEANGRKTADWFFPGFSQEFVYAMSNTVREGQTIEEISCSRYWVNRSFKRESMIVVWNSYFHVNEYRLLEATQTSVHLIDQRRRLASTPDYGSAASQPGTQPSSQTESQWNVSIKWQIRFWSNLIIRLFSGQCVKM